MISLDRITNLSLYGRGIAILMIVIFHLFDSIHKVDPTMFHNIIFKMTHFGSQGIHFFFFSSAFFLYLKHNNISKYNNLFLSWLGKRLLKLYPTYIASIIVIVSLFYIFNFATVTPIDILINLLPIIRNFDDFYIHSINGNFWFLHTLIEFYLVFPLLVKIIHKMSIIKFLLLSYLVVLIYITSYSFYFSIDSSSLNPFTAFFINYLYDFSLGIALAIYLKENQKIDFKITYLIAVFFIFEAIGVYLSQIGAFGRNINDIFFSLASIIFIFGSSHVLTSILSLIKTKNNYITVIINFLTTKVYDIYLVHHPVIKIVLVQVSTYSPTTVVIAFFIIFPIALLNFYITKLITKAIQWTK